MRPLFRPIRWYFPSVGLSICQSLNIPETDLVFLKLCMKLGVNKVKKVTRAEFQKNSNPGIKVD